MREPAKIVAAIDIATSMRRALADEFERHGSTGWDEEVLQVELGRLLGFVLRWQDARPSAIERLVDTLRSVHAGLKSGHAPDATDAVRELCPQSDAGTGSGAAADGSPPIQ